MLGVPLLTSTISNPCYCSLPPSPSISLPSSPHRCTYTHSISGHFNDLLPGITINFGENHSVWMVMQKLLCCRWSFLDLVQEVSFRTMYIFNRWAVDAVVPSIFMLSITSFKEMLLLCCHIKFTLVLLCNYLEPIFNLNAAWVCWSRCHPKWMKYKRT